MYQNLGISMVKSFFVLESTGCRGIVVELNGDVGTVGGERARLGRRAGLRIVALAAVLSAQEAHLLDGRVRAAAEVEDHRYKDTFGALRRVDAPEFDDVAGLADRDLAGRGFDFARKADGDRFGSLGCRICRSGKDAEKSNGEIGFLHDDNSSLIEKRMSPERGAPGSEKFSPQPAGVRNSTKSGKPLRLHAYLFRVNHSFLQIYLKGLPERKICHFVVKCKILLRQNRNGDFDRRILLLRRTLQKCDMQLDVCEHWVDS